MKHRFWLNASLLGVSLSALVAGCTGVVAEGAPGGAGSGGGSPGPDPIASESECVETASLAPARIWLLTDAQYVNIVRDSLGVSLTAKEVEITTAGSQTGVFTNKSEAFKVDRGAAKGYQRTAVLVAERLLPTPSTDSVGVQSFIQSRISRAWRRPVTAQETAALTCSSTTLPRLRTARHAALAW